MPHFPRTGAHSSGASIEALRGHSGRPDSAMVTPIAPPSASDAHPAAAWVRRHPPAAQTAAATAWWAERLPTGEQQEPSGGQTDQKRARKLQALIGRGQLTRWKVPRRQTSVLLPMSWSFPSTLSLRCSVREGPSRSPARSGENPGV